MTILFFMWGFMTVSNDVRRSRHTRMSHSAERKDTGWGELIDELYHG